MSAVFVVLSQRLIQQRLWRIVQRHMHIVLQCIKLSCRTVSHWVRRDVEWDLRCVLVDDLLDWSVLEWMWGKLEWFLSELRSELFWRDLSERMRRDLQRRMPSMYSMPIRLLFERMRRDVEWSMPFV